MPQSKPFRVLCIDGGGIRGIVPAVWLSRLERVLERRPGRPRLTRAFDLVCGTSTGSILAAAIATGVPMTRVLNLFIERGPEIFRVSKRRATANLFFPVWDVLFARYSHQALKRVLRDTLGEAKLLEAQTRLCIPTYDLGTRSEILFRSYDPETRENEIWKAALSSSSAPTYFPVHRVELADNTTRFLVDGGVVANNPVGLGLAEAIRVMRRSSLVEAESRRAIQIVSLGTGSSTRNLSRKLKGNQGVLPWANSFVDVIFDGSSIVQAYIAEQILEAGSYKRLQLDLTNGSGSDDLDDASKSNLETLKAAATHYINKEGKTIFADIVEMISPQRPERPPGPALVALRP